MLFNLDINEFQGVESLQLIIQDIRLSEDYLAYFENENKLFSEICKGKDFSAEDGILPQREEFVTVYTLLRREFRAGNDIMDEKELFYKIDRFSKTPIRLVKLKFILQILNELKICTVDDSLEGFYKYDIYFNSEKTSIEKSGILKKLKNQCRRK